MVGAISLIGSMVMVLPTIAGAAAPTVGGFEIEGNFLTDEAGNIDWDSVGDVTRFDDAADSQSDDVYGGGNKEQEPGGFAFLSGPKPPGKADITRVYVADEVTADNAYLWLGMELLSIQGEGDVHANFELNRSSETVTNGSGTVIPQRLPGDVLIVYDYAGGGGAVNVEVRTWSGTPLTGSWSLPLALPAGSAIGAVNAVGSVARPAGAPFGGGSVDEEKFAEVGVDLAAIFGDDFLSCPGFATFTAKSRSSGESFNSQLKDLVGPNGVDISTCGSMKVLKVDDLGAPLAGATFEAWADNDDSGTINSGDTLAGTCTTELVGTGSGQTAECSFGTLEPGDYLVRETDAPDGYDIDPDVVAVTVGFREDVTVSPAFVDPLILGSVRIVKTDSLGNQLEGIRFQLLNQAGQPATKRDGSPAECTTGSNGECVIDGLVPGSYTLHEDPASVGSAYLTVDDQPVTVVGDEQVTVNIVNPARPNGIEIVKTPNATLFHVGDTVTYTMVVSLVGLDPLPLHDVVVSDPPPECDSDPTLVSKTGSNPALLEIGEVWTYTCDHVVLASDGAEINNTATATGTDELDRTVTDDDTATVNVINPVINVEKTASAALVHVGDTVTYTFVVTNPGDTRLHDVTLSDPPPECDADPVRTEREGDDEMLDPGEAWTYTCDHVVLADDDDPLLNTAVATGTDDLDLTVDDDDTASVDIIKPAIEIVKTANPTEISVSGPVTFTYVVTNTGDVTLTGVDVTDDILGFIGTIGTLEPGQSATLTRTVNVDSSSPTRNVGTTRGTDPLGRTVTDDDDAVITVVLGAVIVRKPELPRTGAPITTEIQLGMVLLLIGGAFQLAPRLRRRPTIS